MSIEAASLANNYMSDGVETKSEYLEQHLHSQLKSGVLKPGQRIPTELSLAKTLSISRTTVRQAFAALERRGMIRRVQGKGTFISEDALRFQGSDGTKDKQGSLMALVIPQIDGFYPALQQGFTNTASKHGGQVIVASTDQNVLKQADILLQMIDRKISGIAIVPTSPNDALTPAYQIRALRTLKIPVVFCHRSIEGIRAPLVTFSGLEVGRMIGRSLLEKGHRRIAFFATHKSQMSQFFLQGLREAMHKADVTHSDDNVFFGSRVAKLIPKDHEAAVRAKLKELFLSAEPPTAIFASFDPEAEFIYLLLNEMGLSVPKDVSLISVGGARREGGFTQHLTSITVDEDEVGRRAFELLHEMQSGQRSLDDGDVSIVSLGISDGKSIKRLL